MIATLFCLFEKSLHAIYRSIGAMIHQPLTPDEFIPKSVRP